MSFEFKAKKQEEEYESEASDEVDDKVRSVSTQIVQSLWHLTLQSARVLKSLESIEEEEDRDLSDEYSEEEEEEQSSFSGDEEEQSKSRIRPTQFGKKYGDLQEDSDYW